MGNREQEDNSANHLLRFLKDSEGEEWRVIGRDVEVDPVTRDNFDFELALGERRIALEVFRLVESEPELEERLVFNQFAEQLGGEMEKRGLNDFSVEIPLVTKESPQAREKKVKAIVDKLESGVKETAESAETEVDHITFRRKRGLGTPWFWSVGAFGMYDGVETARRILERMLPKKNKQVSMPGHEGALLVVHWLGLVNLADFMEACKRVDFGQYPNISRIYFEEGPANMALAFRRVAAQNA